MELLSNVHENGQAVTPRGRSFKKKIEEVIRASKTLEHFKTLFDRYPNYQLDAKHLEFQCTLGEGRYTDVGCYKYTHPDGKWELLAIKKLKDIDDSEQQEKEEDYLTGEINLYRKLTHSHLVGFRGTGFMQTAGGGVTVFLAQELMAGGSLHELLLKQHRLYANPRTERYLMYMPWEAFVWLRDVATALEYLHTSQPMVIHRDLQLGNVLLTQKATSLKAPRRAKLSDFGIHRLVTPAQRVDRDGQPRQAYKMTGGVGSYLYMAPELWRGEQYNEKVDIFAWAVMAWELFCWRMLLSELVLNPAAASTEQLHAIVKTYVMAVSQDCYRQPLPEYLPPAMADLLEEAWHDDHRKRPSAVDLVARLNSLEPQMSAVNDRWLEAHHVVNLEGSEEQYTVYGPRTRWWENQQVWQNQEGSQCCGCTIL